MDFQKNIKEDWVSEQTKWRSH